MITAPLDPSEVLSRLARCPVHAVTPLHALKMSGHELLVKDESTRMGLGSFKALGGAYAALRMIEQAGENTKTTFVTASAGNHGLSVAAGAAAFGARARIHLSESVPDRFAARLAEFGAEVVRSGATYETSVEAAIEDAAQSGAIHLADGSWPGYTQAPRLVMEGYTVIAEELSAAFRAGQHPWPERVYLQAGVGGMAAAVAARIRANWDMQPRIIVVEPEAAPCLRDSVEAGACVTVEGPVSTMGRLDCKAPSLLAFDILKEAVDAFVTVSDVEAQQACDALSEAGHATTLSGAAGLAALLREPKQLGAALVILSEGAG